MLYNKNWALSLDQGQIPNGREHPYALLPSKGIALEVGTLEGAGYLRAIT